MGSATVFLLINLHFFNVHKFLLAPFITDLQLINIVAIFYGYLISCERWILKEPGSHGVKKWISEK